MAARYADDDRPPDRTGSRPDPGDGRRRIKIMRGKTSSSSPPNAASRPPSATRSDFRPALHAAATQPSDRRFARNRRQPDRRTPVWRWRRGDRRQSGDRSREDYVRIVRCSTTIRRAPRHPDANMLPGPRDDGHPGHRSRRAGRSRLSIDCRLGKGQSRLRDQFVDAGRGPGCGAFADARHGRPERHVFRNRPRQRAIGRSAFRRRPADDGSARIRRRAALQPASRQYGGRLHWSGISLSTARRSSAPGWRIISAASCSACRWDAMFATPIMPKPIRTIWMCC